MWDILFLLYTAEKLFPVKFKAKFKRKAINLNRKKLKVAKEYFPDKVVEANDFFITLGIRRSLGKR